MKTLSIKARLALVLFVLAVFLAGVGALGLVGNMRSNAALKETYSNNLASTRALGQAESKLAQARTALDRAVTQTDAAKATDAIGRVNLQIQNSDKAWASYLTLPFSTPEEEKVAGEAKKLREIVKSGIGEAIAAIQRGDSESARRVAMETVPAQFRAYAELSDRLNAIQMELSTASYERAQSFFNGLVWAFIIVIALGITLAAGCYLVLSRAISRPLAEMLVHFHEISGGNLTTDVRIHSRDEMGLLMEGLQQMQAKLKETVVTVRRGSESIASATQQIAAGNTNLSQRTEEQASSLEETASSMEELTSIVKQNADNARQASTLAVNASDIAVQGGAVVQDVVTTMGEISESSRKITDIIAVIEGIAFQTNILALNAAVEAARAGEQGRGFAVVAGEVRTLAQRSAGAAKEIKSLIEDSATRVESGSTLVARAGKTMEEIVVAVKRVTDIMGEISAGSAEQSTGIEQINEAVTQMDDVTQQNAALVEEAAAAAQALEEQADELRRAVAVFRVAM
ncbi:HAMP domain-containing protein [Ralstonia sp. TCR112]|uniref:methyl-accepting chemotaxis protein n=1 Tax=Ralstonia sp. TCR112 TaxID=2601730 RepID=UPI0011BE3321|nr:methyl-accepting chemotaxis protein [Ralstonia sp. TCR112]TXD56101.1 HAMP domain-containing protein [Ralstonia sp. TCR112]